jgi:hypothetical protein
MKRATALLAATVLISVSTVGYALYSVADTGTWPESWPEELEPLRKQSRTYVGPQFLHEHYLIPFMDRDQFEAAWPHLLKVKSEGAPIILVGAPKTDFMQIKPAGVLIHSPPVGLNRQANPEAPLKGQGSDRSEWMWTTYIELVVDGDIVDLNRIPLPPDTPIIDERFQAQPEQIDRRSD